MQVSRFFSLRKMGNASSSSLVVFNILNAYCLFIFDKKDSELALEEMRNIRR